MNARVLLFAQTPPPVHGQSVMAAQLLAGLRATGQADLASGAAPGPDARIGFVHVDPKISDDLADIGRWRAGKIAAVFRHVAASIRARFAHRLDTFYFVPAPPKREAIYRDWVVLLLCRPFFRRLVLHWHCLGQPAFLEERLSAPERFFTRLIYARADLSIVLSNYSREEAAYFFPARTIVIPNGIPDPCPRFDEEVWPDRLARHEAWRAAAAAKRAHRYEVLFLSGRMTEKGLFDALAAVTEANRRLAAEDSPLRVALTVAGEFADAAERARFDEAARSLDELRRADDPVPLVRFAGWADEDAKPALYGAADGFLFPTTYPAESFGLVLAEAMAHGCAVITTRWQAVPEVLPGGYPHIVAPHAIAEMADALLACAAAPPTRDLRDYFLARFTASRFAEDMVEALASVGERLPPNLSS
jgi:glycosyltransferase involved in cell wall biosynthesis